MIVPRLKGGVANQLFCIAAGYSKSLDLGTTFAINYNLPHAGGQGKPPIFYKDTLYQKIPHTDITPTQIFNEPAWSYSPLPNNPDMLIDGYFQSNKHFMSHNDEIRELFVFPEYIKTKINNALSKLKRPITGIHVRLGDYLQPGYITTHLTCTRDYYINAIEKIEPSTVIVTTDDVENYTKYINIPNAIICNSKSELEDLYLLSHCDNMIMSNSSFSWWGAFLGSKKKTVCAPSKWFGQDGPKDYSDIYDKSWIII